MARPKGEGKTPGSGRKKGTPNKSTAEVKSLAQNYGPEAIEKLAKLMRGQDERIDRLIGKLLALPPGDKNTQRVISELLSSLEERSVQNELGAAKEILDRGYGRAAQPVTGEGGEGPAELTVTWQK